MTGSAKLNSHNLSTLEKLMAHPTSHNIEWHDVESLLHAVGTVEGEHHHFRVTLGEVTEVFDRKGKDLSIDQVVDLRHMLKGAGFDLPAKNGAAKH